MGSRTSRDFRVTVVFVLLGVVLWLVAGQFADAEWIQWAILVGVGVIVPTILTERV